jgi:hypothetical protein
VGDDVRLEGLQRHGRFALLGVVDPLPQPKIVVALFGTGRKFE